MPVFIYKIVSKIEWETALKVGVFQGAEVDLKDGYIHFSTASQVRETAAKHFADQQDLLLIKFDAEQFGESLKWEVSRGGQEFPHLYIELDCSLAESVVELNLDANGSHVFPDEIQ